MSYLLPRNALMIKNFSLLEVEPRHISAPELNQIPNMARSGFQQKKHCATPFFFAKTNSYGCDWESAGGSPTSNHEFADIADACEFFFVFSHIFVFVGGDL